MRVKLKRIIIVVVVRKIIKHIASTSQEGLAQLRNTTVNVLEFTYKAV